MIRSCGLAKATAITAMMVLVIGMAACSTKDAGQMIYDGAKSFCVTSGARNCDTRK